MRENRQTTARKQRDRTTEWRQERKKKGVPEARAIDRAIVLALAASGLLEEMPAERVETMLGMAVDFLEAEGAHLKPAFYGVRERMEPGKAKRLNEAARWRLEGRSETASRREDET